MKNKNYNLTELPNEGIKDKAPEWMDKIFKKEITASKNENVNSLKNVKNIFAMSNNKNISKCSICDTPLKDDEIDVCNNCQ